MSDTNRFGLHLRDFAAFGDFDAAGLMATTAALERVERSFGQARVPIAGAAVHMDDSGELTVLAVGNNGRIPAPPGQWAPPDPEGKGYPTDHGETATIRQIDDVGAVDWGRVVFTTSLNPCIMCNRTLTYLWTLGLNKIVVADVSTYEGTAAKLKALPGMTMVELKNPTDADWMTAFARTYPWDWNADIGEIPPGDLAFVQSVGRDPTRQRALLSQLADAVGGTPDYVAAVATADALVAAADERASSGGNPTQSAPMIAMGRAGSSRNLRECVLVFAARECDSPVGVADFGHSSLGACELFRPGTLLSSVALDAELKDALRAAGVPVIEVVDAA